MEAIAGEFARRRAACGHRVPEDLRALAVRYARWALEDGAAFDVVATKLTICRATLERWLDDAPTTAAMLQEVIVGGDAEAVVSPQAETAALVTPDGFRIEGLSLSEVVAVVQALR